MPHTEATRPTTPLATPLDPPLDPPSPIALAINRRHALALAAAGAMGGVPGSPTPSGCAVLAMISVVMTGQSLMRSIGTS